MPSTTQGFNAKQAATPASPKPPSIQLCRLRNVGTRSADPAMPMSLSRMVVLILPSRLPCAASSTPPLCRRLVFVPRSRQGDGVVAGGEIRSRSRSSPCRPQFEHVHVRRKPEKRQLLGRVAGRITRLAKVAVRSRTRSPPARRDRSCRLWQRLRRRGDGNSSPAATTERCIRRVFMALSSLRLMRWGKNIRVRCVGAAPRSAGHRASAVRSADLHRGRA